MTSTKQSDIIHTMSTRYITSLLFSLICTSTLAAPFVTENMMKRNGLTDEQYELLWSQGKRPQIEQSAAREWIFRSSRYDNVVEWLQTLGKTNDFAKLAGVLSTNCVMLKDAVASITAQNTTLSNSFARLKKVKDGLAKRNEELHTAWTNADYQASIESNRAARAEQHLARAKSTLTERREEYVAKRDDAKLQTTKAIYQTFIDIIDAIIAKMDEEDKTDENDSAVGE